jgi:GTPase SAR1 family protein
VQWADAYVVVYSITDKQSFEYAQEVLKDLPNLRPDSTLPVTLLANKLDLVHLREVSLLPASCHV